MDMTTFRLRRAAAVTKRVGQQEWTTPGLYEFIVPMSVFTMCGVCIGGAPGGSSDDGSTGGAGGNGGQLRYINDFPVTPGEKLTIEVGTGGAFNQNDPPQNKPGGVSQIRRGTSVIVRAFSGTTSSGTPFGNGPFGGTVGGGNGGQGGSSNTSAGGGGGGAGGYAGVGGQGTYPGITSTGQAGVGGAGGGAAANLDGGGVGIYGQGANGSTNGGPGSGGSGKLFGGGGGGSSTAQGAAGNPGGAGACRIIWGFGRAYPSTRTADEFP